MRFLVTTALLVVSVVLAALKAWRPVVFFVFVIAFLAISAPSSGAVGWLNGSGSASRSSFSASELRSQSSITWTNSANSSFPTDVGNNFRPCIVGTDTYVAYFAELANLTTARLTVLQAASGAQVWRESAARTWLGCPTISGDVIVGQTNDGMFRAYRLSDGTALWQQSRVSPVYQLISDSGYLVTTGLGSGCVALEAVNLANGSTVWSVASAISANVPMAVADGNVFAVDCSGSIVARSLSTGALIWSSTATLNDHTQLASQGGKVFYANGSGLGALNATTGATVWTKTLAAGTVGNQSQAELAASNSTLVAYVTGVDLTPIGVDSSTAAIAVSSSTGATLWTMGLPTPYWWESYSGTMYSPIISSERLVLGRYLRNAASGEAILNLGQSPSSILPPYAVIGGELYGWANVSQVGGAEYGVAKTGPYTPPPDSGSGGSSGDRGSGGASSGGGTSGGGGTTCASPPAGPIGVSVNDGALYTNTPQVEVNAIWPRCSDKLTVSNDGGFKRARQFDVAESIDWVLASSGPERLPKTVYVRFGNASQTFSDDIILDETDPSLTSVTAASATPRRAPFFVRAGAFISVTTVASDRTSGVGRIQVTTDKRRPGRLMPYAKTVKSRINGNVIWVRVQDRAGNFSPWRQSRVW